MLSSFIRAYHRNDIPIIIIIIIIIIILVVTVIATVMIIYYCYCINDNNDNDIMIMTIVIIISNSNSNSNNSNYNNNKDVAMNFKWINSSWCHHYYWLYFLVPLEQDRFHLDRLSSNNEDYRTFIVSHHRTLADILVRDGNYGCYPCKYM